MPVTKFTVSGQGNCLDWQNAQLLWFLHSRSYGEPMNGGTVGVFATVHGDDRGWSGRPDVRSRLLKLAENEVVG